MKVYPCLFRAFAVLPLIAVPLLVGCGQSKAVETAEAKAEPAAQHEDPVKRGEYLVAVGACNDCHTPFAMGPNGPAPDMTRMLSGHPADVKVSAPGNVSEPWVMLSSNTNTAFFGPWGISYSLNLTPDATGIGSWTEAMFVKALKSGRHMGDGRMILPPMPWQSYSHMTDEDLKAIFAYLKSVPPVANKVPEYTPGSQLAGAAPGQ
jgi:mono/diheme cytochrome c family protein